MHILVTIALLCIVYALVAAAKRSLDNTDRNTIKELSESDPGRQQSSGGDAFHSETIGIPLCGLASELPDADYVLFPLPFTDETGNGG